MQGNTIKACIRAGSSYLSHLLKPDNLQPICKNVSEHVLRH